MAICISTSMTTKFVGNSFHSMLLSMVSLINGWFLYLLKKSYGILLLDYVDFITALYRIMDIVNSRPLTYVSFDEMLMPLTPNHFLRLRNDISSDLHMTVHCTDSTAVHLVRECHCITGIVENFWNPL